MENLRFYCSLFLILGMALLPGCASPGSSGSYSGTPTVSSLPAKNVPDSTIPATGLEPSVTPRDDEKAIRSFMDDPTESIVFQKKMTTADGKELEIYAANKSQFYVDSDTGQVIGAVFLSREPVKSGPYTLESAETPALVFVRNHYPSFSSRNMHLISSKVLDHGDAGVEYSYTWAELVNGVNIGNQAGISIDPNGKILSYHSSDGHVPHVEPAKITLETANSTAVNYILSRTNISNITRIESSGHLTFNQPDRTEEIWSMQVEIRFMSPYSDGGFEDHRGGWFQIDAMNGTVVGYEPCA